MRRITDGGQISLPAEVRRRWGVKRVTVEDRGDEIVVRPLSDDPIAALRGVLKGRIGPTDELRRIARADELAAERRKYGR